MSGARGLRSRGLSAHDVPPFEVDPGTVTGS